MEAAFTKLFGEGKGFYSPLQDKNIVDKRLENKLLNVRDREERIRFLPFVQEIIADPHEIWEEPRFDDNHNPFIRRTYIKRIGYETEDGNREKTIQILADKNADGYDVFNLIPKTDNKPDKIRHGIQIYQRGIKIK
ncbi:MAG: hypothetical protein K0U39_07875 [Alphaproteobacteria bacterium]|nr:hypothetical protein [Alphaproteobacteria bacterium]